MLSFYTKKDLDNLSNILDNFGISVKNADEPYRMLHEITDDISAIWDKLSVEQKRLLTGKYHSNKVEE